MEDWDIIDNALKISKDDSVLTIASGGDNVFHSILSGAHTVLAIDNNHSQISISKLKQACINDLNYDEYSIMLGIVEGDRQTLLNKVNFDLTNIDSESLKHIIVKGINKTGELNDFLKYMQDNIIEKMGLNNLLKLFYSKDVLEKEKIWNNYFDEGSDIQLFIAEFLSESNISDSFIPAWAFNNMAENPFHKYYLYRMKERFLKPEAINNYYLYRMFLGTIPHNSLLPYMQEANFSYIKQNLKKINWEVTNIVELLNTTNYNFNKINLSNVPDWLNQNDYNSLWDNLTKKTQSGTRVFSRSFLKERHLPEHIKDNWIHENQNVLTTDRIGYFSRYDLWIKK